jgi:arsenite oxidase small subunit
MAAVEEGSSQSPTTFSRRALLLAGAAGTVGVATGADVAEAASADSYPTLRVVRLARLKPNRPVAFDYPLKAQPSVLLDMGRAVPNGVGPTKSIVAYSLLCQHMGCPVEYEPALREFVCPCHQTRYDPERLASIVQGVAMLPLPRVLLEAKDGSVDAVGVDGLIYGYRDNLEPGKVAGGAK